MYHTLRGWPRTRQRVQNPNVTQGKTYNHHYTVHPLTSSGPYTTNGGLPSSRGKDCDKRLTEGPRTHKGVDAAHQQSPRDRGEGGWGVPEGEIRGTRHSAASNKERGREEGRNEGEPSSGMWGRSEDQQSRKRSQKEWKQPSRRHWEEEGGGRRRTPRSGHGISGQRVTRMVWKPDRSHMRSNQRPPLSWTERGRARVNRGGKERKGHAEGPGAGRSPK